MSLNAKERDILNLLAEHGELFGLEMVRLSTGLMRGTVYVTLHRMAQKGLVESREVPSCFEGGLPRRLYRATPKGSVALAGKP